MRGNSEIPTLRMLIQPTFADLTRPHFINHYRGARRKGEQKEAPALAAITTVNAIGPNWNHAAPRFRYILSYTLQPFQLHQWIRKENVAA